MHNSSIASKEGANVGKSLRWPIYFINPVDNTKLPNQMQD